MFVNIESWTSTNEHCCNKNKYRSGTGNGGQPSAAQLRMLVQQIQMAVSAGYLNHQILNQPLAPQTLVLLNQLLQQVTFFFTLYLELVFFFKFFIC